MTRFDTTTLRRSTGFTKWKSPNVVDDTPSADRATFVRAELVADEIEGFIADVGLAIGMRGTRAALNELSDVLGGLVRELRQ